MNFVFFYQVGPIGATNLDPNQWTEIIAHTMQDVIQLALAKESKSRQIALPTKVYVYREDAPRWDNGAPQAVHAFTVDQVYPPRINHREVL